MKKLLFVSGLMMMSAFSQATSVEGTKITSVRSGTWYGHLLLFSVENAPDQSQVDCHNLGPRGDYVIDTSKPGGEMWASMVLAAYASNARVSVWGSGACISVNQYQGEELETLALN